MPDPDRQPPTEAAPEPAHGPGPQFDQFIRSTATAASSDVPVRAAGTPLGDTCAFERAYRSDQVVAASEPRPPAARTARIRPFNGGLVAGLDPSGSLMTALREAVEEASDVLLPRAISPQHVEGPRPLVPAAQRTFGTRPTGNLRNEHYDPVEARREFLNSFPEPAPRAPEVTFSIPPLVDSRTQAEPGVWTEGHLNHVVGLLVDDREPGQRIGNAQDVRFWRVWLQDSFRPVYTTSSPARVLAIIPTRSLSLGETNRLTVGLQRAAARVDHATPVQPIPSQDVFRIGPIYRQQIERAEWTPELLQSTVDLMGHPGNDTMAADLQTVLQTGTRPNVNARGGQICGLRATRTLTLYEEGLIVAGIRRASEPPRDERNVRIDGTIPLRAPRRDEWTRERLHRAVDAMWPDGAISGRMVFLETLFSPAFDSDGTLLELTARRTLTQSEIDMITEGVGRMIPPPVVGWYVGGASMPEGTRPQSESADRTAPPSARNPAGRPPPAPAPSQPPRREVIAPIGVMLYDNEIGPRWVWLREWEWRTRLPNAIRAATEDNARFERCGQKEVVTHDVATVAMGGRNVALDLRVVYGFYRPAAAAGETPAAFDPDAVMTGFWMEQLVTEVKAVARDLLCQNVRSVVATPAGTVWNPSQAETDNLRGRNLAYLQTR